jgi:hypothetical protein
VVSPNYYDWNPSFAVRNFQILLYKPQMALFTFYLTGNEFLKGLLNINESNTLYVRELVTFINVERVKCFFILGHLLYSNINI